MGAQQLRTACERSPFFRHFSGFTVKESSPQRHGVRMVRQAHHERKKTAHPERVEGLRDLSASAVQAPSPSSPRTGIGRGYPHGT